MFSLFTSTPPAFRDGISIGGERILLRPLSVSDAEIWYSLASDPRVLKYLPWDPAPNVDSVRPYLQEQVGHRKRCESLGFAIVLRETGRMIGSIDLMDLRSIKGQAEVGYLMAPAFWGHGYMTESSNLAIGYGFRSLGLERVISYADEENAASRRVMEKTGMRHTASEQRIVKQEQRPYVRYEITRAAWEQRAGALCQDSEERSV